MPKQYYFAQESIQDARGATTNYSDDHYKQFLDLLFSELLYHIQYVKFDDIIRNELFADNSVHKTQKTNGLLWPWTADRRTIDECIIYSFHFANTSHPELYQAFNTTAHSLFQSIGQTRDGLDGWYQYTGEKLPGAVDRYLGIQKVLQTGNNHTTSIFINQAEERLDIVFELQSTHERITITFERGTPAS